MRSQRLHRTSPILLLTPFFFVAAVGQTYSQANFCNGLGVTITPTQISCNGGNNGSATANPTGGNAPYNYSWAPGGQTTQTITNLAPGTYTVTVTDNSCQPSGMEMVSNGNFSAGNSGFSSTYNICNTANCLFPEGNYAVGTNPNFYHPNFNGSGHGGSGNFMIVNGHGTPGTDVWCQTITVLPNTWYVFSTWVCSVHPASPAQLQFSANGVPLGAIFSAPGAINTWVQFFATWYSGSATTVTICILNQNTTAAGNDFGLDDISFQQCTPCTTTATVTITQPAPVTATITAQTNNNCFGGTQGSATVTAGGGTPGYTYSWAPSGGSGATASNLAAGTYTVTVTDSRGCSQTSSVTITQPTQLNGNIASQTNVSCFGGSNGSATVSASGGTPGYTYAWAPSGGNGPTATNLTTGSYTVTITDTRGCTRTATVNITQPPQLAAAISSQTNVTCYGGASGSATVTAGGGTPGYTYSWTPYGGNGSTAVNLAAGSYTVTVTDAAGCTVSTTATITQSAQLTATITAQTPVSCFGGNNGSATVTAGGGMPGYSYNWAPYGGTGATANNLGAGVYTVTVTDAGGCTSTTSVTITQPSTAPSVSIPVVTNVSCYAGFTGSATAVGNGGTSPYTYLWNTGANTAAINSLSSGTYTVTVTDNNGCTSTASVTITQPAAPLQVSIPVTTNVNCYSGATGSVNSAVSGGTNPYAYLWNTGATTSSLSNVPAGTYTVTVTDNNGCTATASANITQPMSALMVNIINSTDVDCFGNASASALSGASGGTAPYSYAWNTGATTPGITNVPSGNYQVTVTDDNGCTSSAAVTLTQPAAPLAVTLPNVNHVNCYGNATGSIGSNVTGGTAPYSYLWSNGATTATINNLAAGSYTVTVTDAHGCTASVSVIITQPMAPLQVTIPSSVSVDCFGNATGSAVSSVNGGTGPYAYLWSNGAVTGNLSGVTSGNYAVTVTDGNGCTATASVVITQPAAPLAVTIPAVTHVNCFGNITGAASTNVTGGTAPYTYAWSNGATTANINGVGAGNYTVTVTDAHGCTSSIVATITQPLAALGVTLPGVTPVNCFGNATGSINSSVNGGTAPYTYAWNNGANTPNLNMVTAGSYTVTVTDNNGCTATSSATVTQPAAALSVVGGVTHVLCFGASTGLIDITVNGGTSPYQYVWSSGAATQDIQNLPAGNYQVTVTDANGCTAVFNNNVNQPAAALAVNGLVTDVLCHGALTGAVDVTVSGGTGPYIYSWSNGGTTQDLNNIAAGNYQLTVTDAHGCVDNSYSATVLQPLSAMIVSGQYTDAQCYGSNDGAIDISVTGGTPGYQFIWSNGATTEDVNGLPPGLYSVVVIDANGCTDASYNVSLTQPVAVLHSAGLVTDVHCGAAGTGSIQLTTTGGTIPYGYAWSNGATSEDVMSLNAGNYTVVVTDAHGCTTTASFTLTELPSVVVTGVISPNLCFGQQDAGIDISVSGGTAPYHILWSNGSQAEDLHHIGPGTYSVTVTDQLHCTATETFSITPAIQLTLYMDSVYTIFVGDAVILNASFGGGAGNYSYSWLPGDHLDCSDCPNPSASPLVTTTYFLTVTDANGCEITGTSTVIVLHDMFVPNTFTPNGDGMNDQFTAVSKSVKEYRMFIFNRWGDMIYQTTKIDNGWDGTYAGSEAQQDVYVYRIEATFYDGEHRELLGHVNLLR